MGPQVGCVEGSQGTRWKGLATPLGPAARGAYENDGRKRKVGVQVAHDDVATELRGRFRASAAATITTTRNVARDVVRDGYGASSRHRKRSLARECRITIFIVCSF